MHVCKGVQCARTGKDEVKSPQDEANPPPAPPDSNSSPSVWKNHRPLRSLPPIQTGRGAAGSAGSQTPTTSSWPQPMRTRHVLSGQHPTSLPPGKAFRGAHGCSALRGTLTVVWAEHSQPYSPKPWQPQPRRQFNRRASESDLSLPRPAHLAKPHSCPGTPAGSARTRG